MHHRQDKTLDRRAFLKKGLVAGGLLAGSGLGVVKLAEATGALRRPSAHLRSRGPGQPRAAGARTSS